MKRTGLLMAVLVWAGLTFAQENEGNQYINSAEKLLSTDGRLVIGGYGEVHYNQPLDADVRNNGKLDVHRLVMLLGYNFSSKTQFVSELEFEHVEEVYVEQAFLQHRLNNYINLRAGLILVPMGITNEYHEPTTFNGVERPVVDNTIAPTTWREIGFGITGNILPASLKYQAYLMNGFNGYDGSPHLNGSNGLRKGRQKGAESFISSPDLALKLEYYGIRGLNVGVSGYIGSTESTLYNDMDKNNEAGLAKADSSVVGITMLGVDARYSLSGFEFRGQFYYTGLSNTAQYNTFTADSNGKPNDLGRAMTGWYVEAGYNVFRFCNTENELVPFIRYEYLNTHQQVEPSITANPAYEKNIITTGLTLGLTKGAVVKADMQFVKNGSDNAYSKVFSVGIGVMF
ncbi:hypothetical protein [Saccharicrinis sp. FJH54]|uniref:hypothetical protein n=1 Tax=Saccharicrinis sp. FJH54 TaxID=3344665 RepID=UPI0035D44D52